MVSLTPEDITAWYQEILDATQVLRERQDEDYKLYRLETFDAGEEYKSYTSNAPMVYADKLTAWIIGAQLNIRIPFTEGVREAREIDSRKERFLLGCLNAADELLALRLEPPLRSQLAFYVNLRGGGFGRALIAKRADGRSYVDITPWDMRHTCWDIGPMGIERACYAIKKTRQQVKSAYGVDIGQAGASVETDGVMVYDYYDAERNIVVTKDRVLKAAKAHGSPRTPVFGAVSLQQPLIQSEVVTNTLRDYAESVFKANRGIYENNNLIMSILLELVARSRKPPIAITSPQGNKTLSEDPYVEGSVLSFAEGDKVEALKLLEAAKETGAFLGLVGGDIQRGSLPHTAYGELAFSLSGYAINSLRQGIDTPLQPRLRTVESAYKQICDLLYDQYLTGRFEPLTLSGRDRGRRYFSEMITPDSLLGAGSPEIILTAELPQDDMTKATLAQILREGPVPLAADLYIRDKILGFQDADQMDDMIKEQMAERVLPEATLYVLMRAAEERGRPDLASMYFGELLQLRIQKMMAAQGIMGGGMGPPGGGGGPSPNGGRPPTARPEMMPQAGMGVPPPMPTPPQGVPPGLPRPGARRRPGAV